MWLLVTVWATRREERLRKGERKLDQDTSDLDALREKLELQRSKQQALEGIEDKLVASDAALKASDRRCSTLALELQQARDHVAVVTAGAAEDRAALSERTQEVGALRETVSALRRSIEVSDEERRAYVSNHDKLVRSLGERVSDGRWRA